MYSYTGKILHVDVATQKTWVEEVGPEFLKKYLGGVGLATRLVYDNTPAGLRSARAGQRALLCHAAPLPAPPCPWAPSTAWPASRR